MTTPGNDPGAPDQCRPRRHAMSPRRARVGGQDITDPVTGLSRLLSDKCATCILRPGDNMHLGPERLRAVIADALAAGTFVVCHDTLTYGNFPGYGPAICRGFFDAHAGRSPALIFLQAFRRLTEVPPPGVDTPGPRGTRPHGGRGWSFTPPLPDGAEPDHAASTRQAPGELPPPVSPGRRPG